MAYELGEVHCWEEECPSVYYLSVLPTIEKGGQYYAVLEGAPITQKARAMGCRPEGVPAWVCRLGTEDGVWAAVEYEVLRYKAAHGLPMPEGKSLRVAAFYMVPNCARTILGHILCRSSHLGGTPSATVRWIMGSTG